MSLLPALVLAFGLLQEPAEKKQDAPQETEKKQDQAPPAEPAPAPSEEPSFLDLDHLELFPHFGVALYSEDFEADPAFCAGISLRAPLPWISRGLLGFETDRIGLIFDLTVSGIRREIGPGVEDDKGALLFVSAGLDVELFEVETVKTSLQVGIQYAHFSDVAELDGGVGLLLGAAVGLPLSESLSLALNPQLSLGSGGDHLWLINLGIVFRF